MESHIHFCRLILSFSMLHAAFQHTIQCSNFEELGLCLGTRLDCDECDNYIVSNDALLAGHGLLPRVHV